MRLVWGLFLISISMSAPVSGAFLSQRLLAVKAKVNQIPGLLEVRKLRYPPWTRYTLFNPRPSSAPLQMLSRKGYNVAATAELIRTVARHKALLPAFPKGASIVVIGGELDLSLFTGYRKVQRGFASAEIAYSASWSEEDAVASAKIEKASLLFQVVYPDEVRHFLTDGTTAVEQTVSCARMLIAQIGT